MWICHSAYLRNHCTKVWALWNISYQLGVLNRYLCLSFHPLYSSTAVEKVAILVNQTYINWHSYFCVVLGSFAVKTMFEKMCYDTLNQQKYDFFKKVLTCRLLFVIDKSMHARVKSCVMWTVLPWSLASYLRSLIENQYKISDMVHVHSSLECCIDFWHELFVVLLQQSIQKMYFILRRWTVTFAYLFRSVVSPTLYVIKQW